MKSWRVLGLVWAVLSLGQMAACDGGGGGGKSDGGRDGDVEDDDGDVDGEVEETTPVADTGVDAGGKADATVDATIDAGPDAEVDSGCVPKGCSDFGYECGEADDGCGGKIPDCGKCKAPETCGAITKNMCDCVAKTCDQLTTEHGGIKVCGAISNGCGGTLECGDDSVCGANKTCTGGGQANECGCTPSAAGCAGKDCGTASDGCGNTVQCGASAGMCTTNRECSAQQICSCKADKTAVCAGKCGTQQTSDGCSYECGTCGVVCTAGGGATCGVACDCPPGPVAGTADDEVCLGGTCCVPQSVVQLCGTAECGTKTNNCGQVIQCGSCTNGEACSSQQMCTSPAAAALIGKYAVRSVGFAEALVIVTRAEGLLLVDIFEDSNGKLMMREQGCWSGAFTKATSTRENTVTTVGVDLSKNVPATLLELDLTQTKTLNGAKEWVRAVQPPEQNANGWRRGRPSYCPEDGSAANPAHPDFGPDGGGVRALGAKKPWLNGGVCNCPKQEVAARHICDGKAGAELTACIADWAQNSLPYQPGKTSVNSDVTDCRVVDEDLDLQPGVTGSLTVELFGPHTAVVKSASVTANVFWGKIDTTGAKAHWGVSQDQAGLKSSALACDANMTDTFAQQLCMTSSGALCVGYDPAQAFDKAHRINPIDFVSLDSRPTPAAGWTCDEIYKARIKTEGPLFGVEPVWPSKYPNGALCM